MKGTPMYTGEFSRPQAPVEDATNAWPLFYHRAPVTSVLWPLFEKTEDRVAVRPFISVYKLDRAAPQWNILWPIVQLDSETHRFRVPPVFWGGVVEDDSRSEWSQGPIELWIWNRGEEYENTYRVVFPFVWVMPQWGGIFPFFRWQTDTSAGHTVFPFWWYQKGEFAHLLPFWLHWRQHDEYHDTHVLWPFFRLRKMRQGGEWRFWPFVSWSQMRMEGDDGDLREMSRLRVLGWLFDREGRDSVNDGGDYSRTSVLWRLYRDEREPDGGRKLDVLFIPVIRDAGGSRH